MTAASGWILYALAVALAIVFWRRMRGRSLDDMVKADADEHHHVLAMLKKHPDGGTWRDVTAWMGGHGK